MRCVKCNADCTYPQRKDGRCPSCKHRFALEPRAGDIISDVGFKSAIDAVSSNGAVRFLPEHVYYEVARRKKGSGGRSVMWTLGGISLAGLLITPFALIATAACVGIGAFMGPQSRINVERSKFDDMWERWIAANGVPPGLIVRRKLSTGAPYRHSDIEHYSFDRAVICDRAETVDVLLANQFHFENNCAVLSVDGYPQNAFATVRAMLKNNPRLSVYALHDATPAGCKLAHTLASDASWFKGSARVVEVGIRPAHVRKLRGVWQSPQPGIDRASVTDEERRWLAKHSCELAAVRPEQVIKRLFKAIVTEEALQPASQYVDSSGGEYYVDSFSFASDATASDGGDDSFG